MSWKISSQVLELRYPPTFVVWDNVGAISMGLKIGSVPLQVVKAGAQTVTLKTENEANAFSFQVDSTRIEENTEHFPEFGFQEVCENAIKVLLSHVKIPVLSRVGHRIFFRKEFNSLDQSKIELNKFLNAWIDPGKLLSKPDGPLASCEVDGVHFAFSNQDFGLHLKIRHLSIQFNANPEFKPYLKDSFKPERYYVEYDIDLFTKKAMDINSFLPNEYIRGNLKYIHDKILPGA
ncbi:MAG TPA: hypothetical protein VHC95_04855 [Opitutales bacterium]|nr:hypothetical protein [Opitutales bacterium]